MQPRSVSTPAQVAAAAALAHRAHEGLRRQLAYLPRRDPGSYADRLTWLADHGRIVGLFSHDRLDAFLGGFVLGDFRHCGPGAFCPDWAHGTTASGPQATWQYRVLYRELAASWFDQGVRTHAVAAYVTADAALNALALTGFGRIMVDAARPQTDLQAALDHTTLAGTRRATAADAEALARLEQHLVAHLARAPVFFRHPEGRDPAAWVAWLEQPDARAWVVSTAGEIAGYIKAQAPQLDVSDAVHDPATLAINGLVIHPEARRQGLARCLLAALVHGAGEEQRALISVDCETANLEAWGFWTRWFEPVAFGHERRI